jgi:ADP-heptose:LPS heptosyltransferase
MSLIAETQTSNRPAAFSSGRLMLCNVGRLGDTILRNSILDSAFRTYGTVDYICGPGNAELLLNDSRLHEITVFRNLLSGFTGLLKCAWRNHYDGFIDLKNHRSRTSLFIARLFRSRVKTGWNSEHMRPFHRDVRDIYEPNQHQTETMRRIGRLAGLEEGEYKPSLALTQESINWFERNCRLERPFIFLNVSATAADRMWPVEKWVQYLRGCGLDKECILVNGRPGDREMVDQLCRKLPAAMAFQPRQFTDVAAAINEARLVFTVDTGTVHVCSALNKPIVALFCARPVGTGNEPLSTRRLLIRARGSICDMDPQEATAATLRHGLP